MNAENKAEFKKLIGLVRGARHVYAWCNWHEDDGDYLKIAKSEIIYQLTFAVRNSSDQAEFRLKYHKAVTATGKSYDIYVG